MVPELIVNKKKYISAQEAQKVTGFTHEHIARLCRRGAVISIKRRGGWYVQEASLQHYLLNAQLQRQQRTEELSLNRKKEYWGESGASAGSSGLWQSGDDDGEKRATSAPRKVLVLAHVKYLLFAGVLFTVGFATAVAVVTKNQEVQALICDGDLQALGMPQNKISNSYLGYTR